MALCPFLVEGRGILLQTNFCSQSPEPPQSLSLPWWSFGSNVASASNRGLRWLLLGWEEEAIGQFLCIYLKLLFQLRDLKALLAKHSPSQSFKDGIFVLGLSEQSLILWNSSNPVSWEHTFPIGPLDTLLPPQVINFSKAHSLPHPEESLTSSEQLSIHCLDFDWNLCCSRTLSF